MKKDDKPVVVPQGHFYWISEEGIQKSKIALIMDQHGEIFLVDLISSRVYWSYELGVDSYYLYVGKDVDNYIDFEHFDDGLMIPYHHNGNLGCQLIAFKSEHDLRERLEEIYQFYRDGIKLEVKKRLFKLDYQSGKISTNQTVEKFLIEMHEYDMSFSSPEPVTIRWHLKFLDLKVTFPNSECPCKVYYARTQDEFVGLCTNLGITELPGGRLVDDLSWLESCRLNKITLKSEGWIDEITQGLYKGQEVKVMRIRRSYSTLGKLGNLRVFDDEDEFKMIRFYGWQEVGDYYYLALENWKFHLEEFGLDDTIMPFSLDNLREIAIGVYKMGADSHIHPRNVFIMHNNKLKLGLPSFMTRVDEVYSHGTYTQNLGKLMLYCSSGGKYQFSDNVCTKELDMCKIPELRHLIGMLISKSPPTLAELLRHPWLWDTHKVIYFIIMCSEHINQNTYAATMVDEEFKNDNVFVEPWNVGNQGLDTDFVNERAKFSNYDYNLGSSLVKIMGDVFSYHEEMSTDVKKIVGDTTQKMELYFRAKFPNLVSTLYLTGRRFSCPNLDMFYRA